MITLASWRPTWRNRSEWWWMLPICARTMGRYAHSELVIGPPGENALCFSSTKDSGVRQATRNVVDGSWDLIPLRLSDWQENYAHTLMAEIQRSAYGWDSIWRFVLCGVKDNIDTYDCSDAVAVVLVRCGYLTEVNERDCWKISPSALQKMVLRREQK